MTIKTLPTLFKISICSFILFLSANEAAAEPRASARRALAACWYSVFLDVDPPMYWPLLLITFDNIVAIPTTDVVVVVHDDLLVHGGSFFGTGRMEGVDADYVIVGVNST